jgi:hypothetical protein
VVTVGAHELHTALAAHDPTRYGRRELSGDDAGERARHEANRRRIIDPHASRDAINSAAELVVDSVGGNLHAPVAENYLDLFCRPGEVPVATGEPVHDGR